MTILARTLGWRPSNDPAYSGERPSNSPAFSGQPTPTGRSFIIRRAYSRSVSGPSSSVARSWAPDAVGDITLGDDQILARIVLAPDHDMAVRMAGVEAGAYVARVGSSATEIEDEAYLCHSCSGSSPK